MVQMATGVRTPPPPTNSRPGGMGVPSAHAAATDSPQPTMMSMTTTPTTTMPYACQACTKRKVRCDKVAPLCSSCRKSRLDCVYQVSRKRKRRPSNGGNGVSEKLAQYERLLHQHGLLGLDGMRQMEQQQGQEQEQEQQNRQQNQRQTQHTAAPSPLVAGTLTGRPHASSESIERDANSSNNNVNNNDNSNNPAQGTAGRLLAGPGTSRYIYSSHWQDLGEDEMQRISADQEEEEEGLEEDDDDDDDEDAAHEVDDNPDTTGTTNEQPGLPAPPPLDVHLLTGPLMCSQQSESLLRLHPSPNDAMILCKAHMENVEPICKILHIPSTVSMVQAASLQPNAISKADECMLFAIYHFAVFSMTEEECLKKLRQPRTALLNSYYFATGQALINASYLQTTNMSILQALVLLLLSCRDRYDPHTYWILTGVAVRIGLRMGIHKDGTKLGLPPFEVQMRRRLFYQLLPLDGIASKMSGTGIVTLSVQDVWDTEPPLNINDDQIWPGMTETPEEQLGATDMTFSLARLSVGKFLSKASEMMRAVDDYKVVEAIISEAESEVEGRFIRYCDIVNPLHVLTSLLARSAVTAMRVRARLPKVRDQSITTAERRELLELSQKIIDTDTTAYAYTSIRKYSWHVRSFFVYGSWDSLIFILTSLRRPDLLQLSPSETEAAWSRVEQIYNNHQELLTSKKQALHIAVGRLTLKAWDSNPHPLDHGTPEPAFISSLRSLRKANRKSRPGRRKEADTTSPPDQMPASDASALSGSGLDIAADFSLDTVDWEFWDQLISDYQAQGS